MSAAGQTTAAGVMTRATLMSHEVLLTVLGVMTPTGQNGVRGTNVSRRPNGMQEIRFHGRGGQGTVVAAILLAKAFFQAGFHVQSFPSFGVERRGAPVEAYLRIGSEKILARTTITAPQHILVQDCRLMQTVAVTQGMQSGGWALLNTPADADFSHQFSEFRLASVDATRIAMENNLGTRTHPMVNTAMIGAFAKIGRASCRERVFITV